MKMLYANNLLQENKMIETFQGISSEMGSLHVMSATGNINMRI